MSKNVSMPILAEGKFTGRALTHITDLVDSKVRILEVNAFDAISKKADHDVLDTFVNTVSSQISDSEARTALASAQAAIAAERSAREEAMAQVGGQVKDALNDVLPGVKADVTASVQSALSLNSNGAPADTAVAEYVGTTTSQTSTALTKRFITSDRGAGVFNLRQFSGDTASAKIATAYRELGELQGEAILQVSDDIVLDAPLDLDIKNVSIDFQGRKLNAGRIKDAPAITFTNTTGRVLPMNRRAFRNLQLIGPGAASAGSIGMRFYTPDGTGTNNARGAMFENVELEGFETGLSFGKNAYLLRFINGHAYKCGTCVRLEDKNFLGDHNQNYGENLAFFGWSFGNSKLGVYMGDNDLTDVNMYGCSFDFLQGGGQRMAVVKSGQLNLTDAHIEFNGELTAGPIISVGPLAAAEVRIKGSRIQHNNVPPANVDYWFESLNPYGSGGLTITDSTLHFVKSNSGYLCDGPGPFHTRNITFPSGTDGSFYAAETVLTSKAQSLLKDPEFSLPEHIDFKVQESSATSATSSPAVSVSNRAGKMVITKHTTGSGSIALTVPVEPGRWYSQGFTLESYQTAAPTGPGKLRLNDQFISENGQGAFGQVIPGRVVSRGEAAWDVSALPGVPKRFNAGYQGSGKKPLPRKAPYWATHYRVIIPVTDLAPGEYVFSEFVVTGL